jgi:glucose-6-phosphate-specific signal transduction histidine kinase
LIIRTIKHRKSRALVIEIYDYDAEHIFQFSDNGKGFETTTFTKGFVLTNIENIILNYSGKFEINSKNNGGTLIQISLPKN